MGKESKLGSKKKRRREKGSQVDANNDDQNQADEHADNEMTHLEEIYHLNLCPEHKGLKKEKKIKPSLKKKGRQEKGNEVDASNEEKIEADEHAGLDRGDKRMEKESKLGLKKKRRGKGSQADANNEDQIHADEHADNEMTHSRSRHKKNYDKRSTRSQTSREDGNPEKPAGTNNRTKIKAKKVNKEMKHKKKNSDIVKEPKSEETLEVDEEKVEEIPSVDEDCSQGMKKWLIKYKDSRPGLKILQDRIDDFMAAYEEQQEQEKKEREALAAEGGWTVVAHQKGRKKTTDTESGVTVGSVAQAAVVDKMGKKKSKEAPLDFYRFQKREAKRNEVMMLQSKFEQDKKRIQQLRAARKFRPY
ncbi:G patch domain-containing protein 4 isoform X2 [Asparagus officinalis]|uniref:G patch domain-containing protein 4 isoform X2 n=1 Tax=Asparagus officinalis TaxID=4686 RepID=UPI00098E71B1|nr:G patch domain-containing protein 4 isoform X2 [Asparagus officinalis]